VDLTDTSETQGVLPLGRGGTGVALSPVVGAVIYADNDSLNQTVAGNAGQVLTSAGGLGAPYWTTVTGTGTVTSVDLTAGTGISVSGGPITTVGSITVTNTAPDQIVSLTGAGLTSVTGTYPNFTITSTGGTGTVSSVDASGGTTGLSFTGGPITTSGTLTLGGTLGVANGGTGATTLGANGVLYGNGTSAIAATAVGTTGQVLVGNTGAAPSWAALASNAVTSFSAGTTGLTPSTDTTGSITLAGTLAVTNGGTGATVAGTARTNLGAAASGANTDITSIALTTGTISAAPTSGTDIVNKTYADSIASGINFHQSVRLATAAALPANTYNNGTSGVGATLTANANAALSVDGVAVVVGNRILVKNEAAQANNGVYTVTQVGDGSTPYILTRATDFDSAGTGVDQIDAGDFFLVTAGSTQSNTSWVQQTPLPITVGTTAIVFLQFGAPITYSAGTGLTLTGTVFSLTAPVAVNLGGTGLTSVGTAGNVLTSDGTVWTSSPPAAGGITYTTVKTSSYTAANSEGVQTDTTGGGFTVTLPATPAVGDQVIVIDTADAWATNNLTVGRNGSTIEGLASDLVCDISGVSVQLVYSGTTWNVFAQAGGAGAAVLSVAGGGTGVSTLTGYVKGSGTSPLTASATIPTSDLTGTLGVANGGTGVTSSTGSGNTVLSSQPSFGSTIGVGGATASASGSGVSFPASQSASTDPNTLDDYEEGSCTITIQDSAGNSATMGSNNVFRYVKVGAFVQVSGTLNWTSISALTAGSRIQFHGLPFAVNSVTNYRAPAIIGSSASGSFNITRAEIAAGADAGNTFIFGTRVSGNNVDGDMVPANLGSAGTAYGFQINYTTSF
jgi:hypothetical protein